ncbi:uncharacterized protein LOC133180664 [Saccostrea echinata]|uniref:uncharacterized protein LOC133180664 n=1 Tax=Saccostrea echinata TaxID=191078 RepID=UPI002A7F830B|nr:uncharacterized protein LOC133180664 [Saccostrea echinata]
MKDTPSDKQLFLLSLTKDINMECFPSYGYVMVVMYNTDTKRVTVIHNNNIGKHILAIQHTSTDQKLYRLPNYITENRKGDIFVSDFEFAVVVKERGERHRFSYTGCPLGSGLEPRVVCIDALLIIPVCDVNTHTVQMIDKDVQFLSMLLKPQQGMNRPQGLYCDGKST